MREPDLVTRAQRAAVALERAWERWRAMHGLSAEPMPPVSSYVGYSIEEPWGRPRVVFGVHAREAELLAALLDHHECVGPFYQADPGETGFGAGQSGSTATPLDEAWSRIPAQAQAAEERPRHDGRSRNADQPRQRWDQDLPLDPVDGPGADGDLPAGPLAFGDAGPPARETARDDASGLPHHDAGRDGATRAADQRRGRRAEMGRPNRRERRAAGRQRSAGARERAAETDRTDGAGHAAARAVGRDADSQPERGPGGAEYVLGGAEPGWPPEAAGPSWADGEVADAGRSGRAGRAASSAAVDITTVDSIPPDRGFVGRDADDAAAGDTALAWAAASHGVPDRDAADRAAAGEAAERAPRGRSLYDVTKASRARAREAGRSRGSVPVADRAPGGAPDLTRGVAEEMLRGEQASGEPVSPNGLTDAGQAEPRPDTRHAGTEPAAPARAGLGLDGPDLGDAGTAGHAPAGLGPGDLALAGEPLPGHASPRGSGDAPGIGQGYPAPTGSGFEGGPAGTEDHWQDTDPGLDYTDDPGLDYAGDPEQDYPGDDGWDDVPGQDDPWATGNGDLPGPGDESGRESGHSGTAGLDQLWDIGRGGAGSSQGEPGAAGDGDAFGPGPHGGTASGNSALGGHGPGTSAGYGPDTDAGASWDRGAPRDASLGTARDSASVQDGGSAWEASPDRDGRGDRPADFGPDPLGVTGDRGTAEFLAAPPPSGTILTTAPRQETRTARPSAGSMGTETIAAELAGWAAGELPGQASARLAAWAAIGGVPATGYRRTDGSDVGAAGVGTERVR